MFRRKFGYESEDYPKFSDLERDDNLDAEVHCTGYGFTKEMEKDLLEEYGMIERDDDDDDEEEEEKDNIEISKKNEVNYTNAEIEEYQMQLENEVKYSEDKGATNMKESVRRYIESCSKYLGGLKIENNIEKSGNDEEKANENTVEDDNKSDSSHYSNAISVRSNDSETEDVPELVKIDTTSRMYRLKMVEQMLSDARSQRSYSTTASTIAPSVITERIKRNMDAKEKQEMRKRCVTKGEASAVHRHRKENKDVVKEYAGWDF